MKEAGFALLVVTDGFSSDTAARVARALDGAPRGTVAVQLRAKALGGRALAGAARALVEVAHARGAKLLVNDRLDVALAVGADGVHLPSRGLPPSVVRRLAPHLVVGVSTHAVDEARRAVDEGADYVTFGPVFATPSKAALGAPVGVEALARAVAGAGGPVYALGGVDVARAPACVAVGARLACIRAVVDADDPGTAAATLVDAVKTSLTPTASTGHTFARRSPM